jgi:hypothetical protein
LVFAVATPLADLVGLDPVGALDHAGVAAAGVVLVVAGVAGAAISQATMGSAWRADVDADVRTDLVVHGSFRWVRNPIFSSTAVTITGFALIVPNVVAAGNDRVLVRLVARSGSARGGAGPAARARHSTEAGPRALKWALRVTRHWAISRDRSTHVTVDLVRFSDRLQEAAQAARTLGDGASDPVFRGAWRALAPSLVPCCPGVRRSDGVRPETELGRSNATVVEDR